jgi:hypothetical protein
MNDGPQQHSAPKRFSPVYMGRAVGSYSSRSICAGDFGTLWSCDLAQHCEVRAIRPALCRARIGSTLVVPRQAVGGQSTFAASEYSRFGVVLL